MKQTKRPEGAIFRTGDAPDPAQSRFFPRPIRWRSADLAQDRLLS
jgi:hypothetical protein